MLEKNCKNSFTPRSEYRVLLCHAQGLVYNNIIKYYKI